MRYLCLVFGAQRSADDAPDERAPSTEVAYCSSFTSLRPVDAAVTVWLANGRIDVGATEASFRDDELVGFSVIDARDLNDAIRMASAFPPSVLDRIVIRPIDEQASIRRPHADLPQRTRPRS